ncbi:hypothetical protein DF16_pBMB11orf00006 (plasmid) [Bacillus thuringiensis serovar kurstaki str. YBT-1520]|uniref:hypothetical protein n=1 Tax=Bacillus thuringiensis TaxID=1428 RepID=UPI0004F757EE|nr:hypothetical protein [Bacillus thuringiensis]AIM34330.1 hypothetical protein DF16_pBMB11orf00006 [Bacillus thuringiensis serovar kurstaki str. YBT-1520]MEB9398940.1 hypothetical protein [Bacillus cereus]
MKCNGSRAYFPGAFNENTNIKYEVKRFDTCRLVENYGERRIILWFIHCCNCFLAKLVYGLGFKGLPSLLRLEIGWGVGLAPHSVMGK